MRKPGQVRDAITNILAQSEAPLTVTEIECRIADSFNETFESSSIRSSLRLQAKKPDSGIVRVSRGLYAMSRQSTSRFEYGKATLIQGDAFAVMASLEESSIHAIVTDPPYGLVEYKKSQVSKLRKGQGGVWRIPPSFDGAKRSPLPRFTTLTNADREKIVEFFGRFGEQALRVLVPGANIVVATNPLVSHLVAGALESAGLEPRGQLVRLVQTMRGGDRPKGFESEYPDVSVMPRSQFEPWVIMRKPMDETTGRNLAAYGTGGWRRIDDDHPFGDVIKSAPTRKEERAIANHPSLKPQKLMRQIVRAALPLGMGMILDPFAGSGSTLAAAESLGYSSLGIERDSEYYNLACNAIPKLTALED